jgi:hypothetical protein
MKSILKLGECLRVAADVHYNTSLVQIYLTSFIDIRHQSSTLFSLNSSLSLSILLFLIGLMFSASSSDVP